MLSVLWKPVKTIMETYAMFQGGDCQGLSPGISSQYLSTYITCMAYYGHLVNKHYSDNTYYLVETCMSI